MTGYQFVALRKKLLQGKVQIDELDAHRAIFSAFFNRIIHNDENIDLSEVEAFLRLCLDYYTYSAEGDVLISDHEYDEAMTLWRSYDNQSIVYPDDLRGLTQWSFAPHEMPGIVGSIEKIYSYPEFEDYLESYRGISTFTIAPKFDGNSVGIRLEKGRIVYALTRYNGLQGRDVTHVIRRACNVTDFYRTMGEATGFYKCEICVSQEHFEKLKEETGYRNRRSATAGIMNSPKNVDLGCYLTIIPLLWCNLEGTEATYRPWGSKSIAFVASTDLFRQVESMLEDIRNPNYPFRVDGVVIMPTSTNLLSNKGDFMRDGIAYKVNTNENKSRIVRGYMSVGPLGNAVPMIEVVPVEVNETTVTEINLGSYDKFLGMQLYEDEEVIVYSAGDAIPQIRLPDIRNNFYNAIPLKIKKRCPYCDKKLIRTGAEYRCENPNCIRIVSGKIVNFLQKMDVKGFKDETIMAFVRAGIMESIPDLFRVSTEDLLTVPKFGSVNAEKFVGKIAELQESAIPLSKFMGALGIPKISTKKCQRIFELVDLPFVLKSKPDKIIYAITDADGIGFSTAEEFASFVDENRETIHDLASLLKVVKDTTYRGNVVFTGFRSDEWESKFRSIGYEVGDSVTGKTVALVASAVNGTSTKLTTAKKKGIPIFDFMEIEEVYRKLKEK